jgi:hypothetical protein
MEWYISDDERRVSRIVPGLGSSGDFSEKCGDGI